MDAILNKSCESLQDCTMYSLILPYNECAKLIVESGIKLLIYRVRILYENIEKLKLFFSQRTNFIYLFIYFIYFHFYSQST